MVLPILRVIYTHIFTWILGGNFFFIFIALPCSIPNSKFKAKAREGIFFGYSMESKAYRFYVIDQKKVIESINITFDDDKLPSLQTKYPNETLKFENLPDSYLEIDDEPEPSRTITSSDNEDLDPSNKNNEGGTNLNSNQNSTSRTSHSGRGSSSDPSNNLGGGMKDWLVILNIVINFKKIRQGLICRNKTV